MSLKEKIEKLKEPTVKWKRIEPNSKSEYMHEVLAHGMCHTALYVGSPFLTAIKLPFTEVAQEYTLYKFGYYIFG